MTENDPHVTRRADGVRTYQGRVLAHQDEPVVDQGLQFDIGTILSRRRTLAFLGGGAALLGLAACGAQGQAAEQVATTTGAASPSGSASTSGAGSSAATTTVAAGSVPTTEIPEETNGPYPGDGSNGPDVLEQSGVVRQDLRSSFGTGSATATGVPMTLELALYDLSKGGAPLAGAAVYVWHCTADGQYSMYANGLEDENYLRGVQVADAQGRVSFTSIFPGCYSGRWPHVHFEVYPDAASITDTANLLATSQVALPQAACEAVYATDGYASSASNLAGTSLAGDNVFGEDAGEHQLGTATGDASSGFTVSLGVGIDPTTEPSLAHGGPGSR